MIWSVLPFCLSRDLISRTKFCRDWMTSAYPHFLMERKRSSRLPGVARVLYRWEAKSGQRLQDTNETLMTLSFAFLLTFLDH